MPLVRDLAAEGIPVVVTCEVLGFSPQAFYKAQARPYSDRDWDDAVLTNAIVDVHADDPEFGYRFIADELEASGHRASENRVHRLCREHKVWSTTTKKGRKGSPKRPGPAVHDDLVQRNFTAPNIDRVWLTDISEHPTRTGKLYICAVKDVCSNRIVGYSIGDRMTAQLAVRALRSAVARRQPTRVVLEPTDLDHPPRTAPRDRHLDRTDLQPTTPPTPTRQTDPSRIRTRPRQHQRPRWLTPQPPSTRVWAAPSASLTRPTDHFQGTPEEGQPFGGSDRMSEALPTHYQASNTHHHILTAVRACPTHPGIGDTSPGDLEPYRLTRARKRTARHRDQ
jgi:HTH-like domain